MHTRQTPAAFVGALCATIGLAAVYEALFALQVIHYPAGATSGTHPQYETHILEIAVTAMALASLVFLVATENGDFLFWWIPIGVLATAVIAFLGRKHPRLAMLVLATVLLVGASTALIIAAFH